MVARSLEPFDAATVAPWSLGDARRGALLLHGFAGTPPELRRLGEHLAAHGWRCRAPALAGHATTPEDQERTRMEDWFASARAELDTLMSECDAVCIAGQSMGGTVALHLAATVPAVRAVATLAAPVWVSDWRAPLLPVLVHLKRWTYPDGAVDLADPEAVNELHSYGRRSTRAVRQFVRTLAHVRAELPMVRQPVLVLHGAGDRVIDPRNMEDIAAGLVCSARVVSELLPRSGHALSVDVERDHVNERILGWFDEAVAAG